MPEILRQPTPQTAPKPKKRRFTLVSETSGPEMRAIGLGLDFTAMAGAGVLLGWGADYLLGTKRWLIIGLVVGLATASWHFYKGARRLNRELDKKPGSEPLSNSKSERPLNK